MRLRAHLPVVLHERREIVGVAVERSAVGHLVGHVARQPEQEVGERVARRCAIEPIPAAEVHAEAEAVARHVAIPEAAALDRVSALDPGEVVADARTRSGPPCGRRSAPRRRCCVGRNGPLWKLIEGNPSRSAPRLGRGFEAELRRDVAGVEVALPLRGIEVVADAHLVDHRGRQHLRPAADHRRRVERRVQNRQVGERVARLEVMLFGSRCW